jgi:AraC family transcriptional activator of pobA
VNTQHRPLHISFLRNARIYGFHFSTISQAVEAYPILSEHAFFDFYTIFFFENKNTIGSAIRIVETEIDAIDGRMMFIPPYTSFVINNHEEIKGFVLFFCKDFYAQELNTIPLLYLFSFFNRFNTEDPHHFIDFGHKSDIHAITGLIKEEYSKSQVQPSIIRSYLNILIHKTVSIVKINNNSFADHSLIILDKLSGLIEMHYRDERNVSFYSKQLNISEKVLSYHCRKSFNSNLKQILNERVIMEARKMLEQTTMTVSEIAFQLNFTDDSNFNKLFKSYTRITPKQYREIHKRFFTVNT